MLKTTLQAKGRCCPGETLMHTGMKIFGNGENKHKYKSFLFISNHSKK